MSHAVDSIASPDGPPPTVLATAEREKFEQSFAENGYFVFRRVVSAERLSSLREAILDAYERARSSGGLFLGGGAISGHLNIYPGQASRFAFETLERRGIVDLVRAMLPEARRSLMRVGGNLNLPGSVAQHYHEDYSPYPRGFFIVNVAVENVDVENGAIELAPGTHGKTYPYWRFALERTHRRGTRVPMDRGDVLVRTSRLWHRGMPNRAATPRPMLAFTLGEDVRPGDPFGFDEGRITFHPNWYRSNFLGRLRERTFVAAPVTYASYRFVKSLLSRQTPEG